MLVVMHTEYIQGMKPSEPYRSVEMAKTMAVVSM